MTWQLHHVEEMECTLDDCGYHVVINRIEKQRVFKDRAATLVTVRADLMGREYIDSSGPSDRPMRPVPIVSFQGSANAVRKYLIRYITDRFASLGYPSPEHASYIGYELLRAELTPHYVQD